jgi:hypothetical protein
MRYRFPFPPLFYFYSFPLVIVFSGRCNWMESGYKRTEQRERKRSKFNKQALIIWEFSRFMPVNRSSQIVILDFAFLADSTALGCVQTRRHLVQISHKRTQRADHTQHGHESVTSKPQFFSLPFLSTNHASLTVRPLCRGTPQRTYLRAPGLRVWRGQSSSI